VTIFKGPVFRIAVHRDGKTEVKDRDRPLPLPDGTFLYGFTSLRKGRESGTPCSPIAPDPLPR